jgi:PadR family transcriptional regulator, regulatory protein PadR
MPPQTTILQGTLDMLILRTLALGPLHGVGVADRIKQVTRGTFDIKAGSLFPALHRLEAEGWIIGEWGASPAGRRAKLYSLTKDGRKILESRKKSWLRVAVAIQQVLDMN